MGPGSNFLKTFSIRGKGALFKQRIVAGACDLVAAIVFATAAVGARLTSLPNTKLLRGELAEGLHALAHKALRTALVIDATGRAIPTAALGGHADQRFAGLKLRSHSHDILAEDHRRLAAVGDGSRAIQQLRAKLADVAAAALA